MARQRLVQFAESQIPFIRQWVSVQGSSSAFIVGRAQMTVSLTGFAVLR
jgi:hypothetical protein